MNLIIKNTLFLYLRQLIVLLVSLYTTRIVIGALGQSDYGLFGTVGGVVLMFTFMTGSLSNATSRFLAYSMGKQQNKDIVDFADHYPSDLVFRTSWRIHLYMAVAVIFIGSTIGWYMVNYYLEEKIPVERLFACNVVLGIVIFRTIITTLQIPLFALNIAHEKMGIYALVGLIDAFGNLFIALAIQEAEMDRLILYAALGVLVNIAVFCTLIYFCKRFKEFKMTGSVDYSLLKQMAKYTVWTLTASLGAALRTNGAVVLVTKYFGGIASAAVIVSQKVCNSINNFTQNFATASNPQIIKQWAGGKINESHQLVCMASRLTWTLLTVLCVPLFLEAEFVMQLWLKDEFTQAAADYTRIMLITCMIDAFSFSASAAIQATGKVARYNLTCSGIIIMSIPTAWVLYEAGYPVTTVMWCICIGTALAQVARIIFLRNLTNFRLRDYARKVLVPCMAQLALGAAIPVLLYYNLEKGVVNSLIILAVSGLSTICFGWPVIRPWMKK